MIVAMSGSPHPPQASELLADADLCVKCGLCLPHCPTYRLHQHEGDSPRGRIALVQGLVGGLIEASERMEAHLDGCLSCRRCDDVCPARVPYSRLLDAGRARLAERRPARTRLTRMLGALLASDGGRALLRGALCVYRGSGLQALLRRLRLLGRGRLARLESLLPAAAEAASRPPAIPAVAVATADAIAVFRGCASDVFERDAIVAVETLLRAAGFVVQPAPGQGCCGALHQHGGLPDVARDCARRNLVAFAGQPRIATLTSGCAATLRDYADLAPTGGAAFAARVMEFSDWLLPRAGHLQFAPLPLRAALHTPCTAASTMKSDASLRALLRRIPQLELVDLDAGAGCCGAAGSQFITQPDQADRLLEAKLASVQRLAPDLVLSGNIGCSLHIAAGLSRRAWAQAPEAAAMARAPVRHPAQLLAQQLVARPELPPWPLPSPPRS